MSTFSLLVSLSAPGEDEGGREEGASRLPARQTDSFPPSIRLKLKHLPRTLSFPSLSLHLEGRAGTAPERNDEAELTPPFLPSSRLQRRNRNHHHLHRSLHRSKMSQSVRYPQRAWKGAAREGQVGEGYGDEYTLGELFLLPSSLTSFLAVVSALSFSVGFTLRRGNFADPFPSLVSRWFRVLQAVKIISRQQKKRLPGFSSAPKQPVQPGEIEDK